MKNRSLVIGRTNAGKTLFCVQFAKYLGIRELQWWVERTDGFTDQKRMSMDEAVRTLTDSRTHSTRQLQSICLNVPRGKSVRQIMVTDTTGLSDGIHSDPDVRQAMAQTLRSVVNSEIIFHVIDVHSLASAATKWASKPIAAFTPLDQQLISFAATRPSYIILANKMDLPGAKQGYHLLKRAYPKQQVIPISAMTGTGFGEVKRHVWRLA